MKSLKTWSESIKLKENFNKNKFICGKKNERYVPLFIIGNTYPIRIEKYFQFFFFSGNDDEKFLLLLNIAENIFLLFKFDQQKVRVSLKWLHFLNRKL